MKKGWVMPGRRTFNIYPKELSVAIDQFSKNQSVIDSMKRCKKCILPETMPFIEFDREGVCNYCGNYISPKLKGKDALEKIVAKYRNRLKKPDCIVGISGGRDSTYGLHYLKTELGMNPVAYTYDWGMATPVAAKNISRICDMLSIRHVVVTADINRKRQYVRKNVEAWLRKPELGMIPLFMAGDKQYFYYLNRLKKESGIRLAFLCENPFERTDFKTGFCDFNQECIDEDHVYTLSLANKIKLLAYYAKNCLSNISYINSSVFDTLFAYISFYLIKRDYLNVYRFIRWDEDKIISTLVDRYGWEFDRETNVTWRIADGTAAFYNYLYYTVAGFTENDTFRSNQIREGLISREEAINRVRKDNEPRFDSIKWYCQTICVDFKTVLKIVNAIPKLY